MCYCTYYNRGLCYKFQDLPVAPYTDSVEIFGCPGTEYGVEIPIRNFPTR